MWLTGVSTDDRVCTMAIVRGASLGKIYIALNNTDRNNTHYPLLLIPLQNTPESSLSMHCLTDLLQKLKFVY